MHWESSSGRQHTRADVCTACVARNRQAQPPPLSHTQPPCLGPGDQSRPGRLGCSPLREGTLEEGGRIPRALGGQVLEAQCRTALTASSPTPAKARLCTRLGQASMHSSVLDLGIGECLQPKDCLLVGKQGWVEGGAA